MVKISAPVEAKGWNMRSLTPSVIMGLDESLLVNVPELGCKVHCELVMPLRHLAAQAQAAGFELAVASSYRSFARQLAIWNAKARGERPLLDSEGQPLQISEMSEAEILWAILRWSALPGSSRHHWGTDLDVFDRANMPADYQVQLTPAETTGDGLFAAFHQWLTTYLDNDTCAFFRPYAQDRGGVAPEPWHLSFRPLASEFAQGLSEAMLRAQLAQTDIALKACILENLSEIIARFVRV
jgi:LAS superfamily LD-carboxypeptidase LdcB